MKKINIYLTLILTLIFMFNILNLLAVDPIPPNFVVNIKTPTPCNDGGPTWIGPKWYKICSDTIVNLNNNNWQKCCYYIKYYDRVEISNSGTTRHYQTNVVGVFFDGVDCEKRSKESIIQEFQEALYQKLCYDDENYFNMIVTENGSYNWSTAETNAYVYTTGGCYQKDAQGITIKDSYNKPLPCNQSNYCCRQSKKITLQRVNGKLIVTDLDAREVPYYEVFPVGGGTQCPTSCNKGCNNVLMESVVDVNCNTDCNEGEWEPNEKYIPMPTCPACPLAAQQIHEAVFENLKNSEFRNLPEINGQSVASDLNCGIIIEPCFFICD